MTRLLALLALALSTRAYAHRIKHVVVLYEENRAFDHLLGHQKALKVDGLKGTESNPIDRKDPSKGSVEVFAGAPYVAVEQPRHGYAPYQMKLDVQDNVPRMDGFVEFEMSVHKKNTSVADAVMQGFSDGALPISTALASEFAVFDRWYTAFPGPSWPNHMFSYSATAAGASVAQRPNLHAIAAASCTRVASMASERHRFIYAQDQHRRRLPLRKR